MNKWINGWVSEWMNEWMNKTRLWGSISTWWFFMYMYLIRGRIWIWECWFLRKGENRSTRRKTSGNKEKNQQQTKPTYGVDAGIWTQTIFVRGECSYYAPSVLAPLAPVLVYPEPYLVYKSSQVFSSEVDDRDRLGPRSIWNDLTYSRFGFQMASGNIKTAFLFLLSIVTSPLRLKRNMHASYFPEKKVYSRGL